MNPLDHPSLFSPLCLVGLLVTVLVGMALRQRRPELVPDAHVDHFNALETSVLSMFALMLGFSFSMAVSRLEYRRNLQIDEANAISTAYLRTATLPPDLRAAARDDLRRYVETRVQFGIHNIDDGTLGQVRKTAITVRASLWRSALAAAELQHRDTLSVNYISAIAALRELDEKRLAALENRIPHAGWAVLLFFAVAGAFLDGLRVPSRAPALMIILPMVMTAGLTLVNDLDTPRSGWVQADQSSMMRLQHELQDPEF